MKISKHILLILAMAPLISSIAQPDIMLECMECPCTHGDQCESYADPMGCNEMFIEGCTDQDACNYDEDATVDNGSCTYPGCTIASACNYNSEAGCDDGSCCVENCLTFNIGGGAADSEIGWEVTSIDGLTIYASGGAGSDFGLTCLEDDCYIFEMTDSGNNGWEGAVYEVFLNGTLLTDGTLDSGGSGSALLLVSENPSSLPCYQPGCTDQTACNYDASANDDDGSCIFIGDSCDDGDPLTLNDVIGENCVCLGEIALPGCTDFFACNYNPAANVDDGSCYYTGDACDDNDPQTIFDQYNELCICEGVFIVGCTDPLACNYDDSASSDDGSCLFLGDSCDDGDPLTVNDMITEDCICLGVYIFGCTDQNACNYNPAATFDDGSCFYPGDPCDDGDFNTINDMVNEFCICQGVTLMPGCADVSACNFDPLANTSNGSCCFDNCISMDMTDSFGDSWNGAVYNIYDDLGNLVVTGFHADGSFSSDQLCLVSGCYTMDVGGGSFDSEIGWTLVGVDDGPISGNAPVFNIGFGVGNSNCTIPGCTDPTACNYMPQATEDDGTCFPSGCMDFFACNYDPIAECDDASCTYPGCTDQTACNFEPQAGCDDSSCCYDQCIVIDMFDSFGDGWNGAFYNVYDSVGSLLVSGTMDDGLSESQVFCLTAGCYTMDVGGGAFDSEIDWTLNGVDNGPISGVSPMTVGFGVGGADCPVYGCTDVLACNYNPDAEVNDGSCVYQSSCPSDLNNDGQTNTSDLLMFLAVFGSSTFPCDSADLNGDGNVDTLDLLIFLSEFGQPCP